MDRPAPGRLGRAALPIVAVLVFVVVLGATVVAAGATLGFDFLAYHQAATRLLAGQPLYDMSFQTTGGFGLFYYPPTFAPADPAVRAPVGDDGGLDLDRHPHRRRSRPGSPSSRSRARSAGG